jgi:alkylhydroperoxidase family enzyme
LDDYKTAPISTKEKNLFRFIEKVTHTSNQVGQSDVDALLDSGWSDEAVYDAVTVCALFKFYNTWVDATGVHDLPAAMYEMSGKRLATEGYSSAAAPPT